MIVFDVDKRELRPRDHRRRDEQPPGEPGRRRRRNYKTGVFAKYAKLVSSAAEGAVTR